MSSPDFRHEARGRPMLQAILFLLTGIPICGALALFFWPAALLLFLAGIYNVWFHAQWRHRALAEFEVQQGRISWRERKKQREQSLHFDDIREIHVHAGPESDLIHFFLKDGSRITLDAGRYGDTVKPISEYLYQYFPGPVADYDNPSRPRGDLQERRHGWQEK